MRATCTFCVLFLLVLQAGGCADPPPQIPSELSPGVWGVLLEPDGPGPHPGVILLHGSRGWRGEIVYLASALTDAGFVTLTLDYYAETGRTPTRSREKLEAWPGYQAAVRDAADYLSSLPSVADEPIGLVGFSRGAFLAVSVGSSIPQVEAIVDFYGGGGGGTAALEEDVQGLPPVLILHGEDDNAVPVRFAYNLRDAIVAAGGEAELHIYAGAKHSFNAPGSPSYSQETADDAHQRMFEFLRRRLNE